MIAGDDQTGGDQGLQEVDDRIELLIELRQACPLSPYCFLDLASLGILRCGDLRGLASTVGSPDCPAVHRLLPNVVGIGSASFPSHDSLASLAVCPGSA